MLIRLGGYQPASSVHSQAMRRVAAGIARGGGREISVSFLENVAAEGRKAGDLLTMVESGELDICYFSSSYLVGRVPSLTLLDLPFPRSDRGSLLARLDGALGTALGDAVAAATGYVVLGYWDNGLRHISNARRPILRPADCAGLKLRTLDNALHQHVFRALGFEPHCIDVADLAAAVEQGLVDAQENPLTNLVNFGLHRHHRHVSLTGHFLGVACVLGHRATVQAWPMEIQRLVMMAVAAATATQRQLARDEDARCLAILHDAGCQVIPPEEIDRAAFAARLSALVEAETATLDPTIAGLHVG